MRREANNNELGICKIGILDTLLDTDWVRLFDTDWIGLFDTDWIGFGLDWIK